MDKKIQVIEWLVDFEGTAPKCCYTCLYYSKKKCRKFNVSPPQEFRLEFGKCDEYKEMVPF